jgi:hypothetical protein
MLPRTRVALASLHAYLILLQVGFGLPAVSPRLRCALTAPFHPYLPGVATQQAVLLSVPLSVALGQADLRLPCLLRLAVSQHLVLRSPDLPPTMSCLIVSGRLALLPHCNCTR